MRSEKFARLIASVTGTLLCALTVIPTTASGQVRSNPLRGPLAATFEEPTTASAWHAQTAYRPAAATPESSTSDNSAAVAAALFHPAPAAVETSGTVRVSDAPEVQPIQSFPPRPASELWPQAHWSQSDLSARQLAALAQAIHELPPEPREIPEPLPATEAQSTLSLPEESGYAVTIGDGLGCDAAGCDGCSSGCGCGPIWDVGTEFIFFTPNMNSAEVRYDMDDDQASTTHSFVVDNLDSIFAAPRFWIGVQGECWGVVGRFFRMTAGHAGHDPFFVPGAEPHTGYMANNLLDAYAIDLEVRRTFCFHDNKLYLGFGPRYALFEQDQSVTAFALVDDDILTGTARSNRQAYGTGISLSFGGRHPLFCNSCAHFFFNMRASILWGCTHAEVQTSASLFDPEATAASYNGAASSIDDDLFIGEIQLGIEWDYQLQWLPANAFFRIAAEYQYWDASQGYAVSGSYADEVDVVTSTAFAEADGLRMNLIGFSIGTGLTW